MQPLNQTNPQCTILDYIVSLSAEASNVGEKDVTTTAGYYLFYAAFLNTQFISFILTMALWMFFQYKPCFNILVGFIMAFLLQVTPKWPYIFVTMTFYSCVLVKVLLKCYYDDIREFFLNRSLYLMEDATIINGFYILVASVFIMFDNSIGPYYRDYFIPYLKAPSAVLMDCMFSLLSFRWLATGFIFEKLFYTYDIIHEYPYADLDNGMDMYGPDIEERTVNEVFGEDAITWELNSDSEYIEDERRYDDHNYFVHRDIIYEETLDTGSEYDYNQTFSKLMHDVETNPGWPTYDFDLDVIYDMTRDEYLRARHLESNSGRIIDTTCQNHLAIDEIQEYYNIVEDITPEPTIANCSTRVQDIDMYNYVKMLMLGILPPDIYYHTHQEEYLPAVQLQFEEQVARYIDEMSPMIVTSRQFDMYEYIDIYQDLNRSHFMLDDQVFHTGMGILLLEEIRMFDRDELIHVVMSSSSSYSSDMPGLENVYDYYEELDNMYAQDDMSQWDGEPNYNIPQDEQDYEDMPELEQTPVGDYDGTDAQLMHDVETNPGETNTAWVNINNAHRIFKPKFANVFHVPKVFPTVTCREYIPPKNMDGVKLEKLSRQVASQCFYRTRKQINEERKNLKRKKRRISREEQRQQGIGVSLKSIDEQLRLIMNILNPQPVDQHIKADVVTQMMSSLIPNVPVIVDLSENTQTVVNNLISMLKDVGISFSHSALSTGKFEIQTDVMRFVKDTAAPIALAVAIAMIVYYLGKQLILPTVNYMLDTLRMFLTFLGYNKNFYESLDDILDTVEDDCIRETERDIDAPVVIQGGAVVKTLAPSVLGLLHSLVSDQPIKGTFVQQFIGHAKVVKEADSAIGTFFEHFLKIMQLAANYLGGLLGKPDWGNCFSVYPVLDEIAKEANDIAMDIRTRKVIITKDIARRVSALHTKFVKQRSLMNKGHAEYDKVPHIERALTSLLAQTKNAYNKRGFHQTAVTTLFAGWEGVGKTYAINLIMHRIIGELLPVDRIPSYIEDPMSQIYSINTGNEFWDDFNDELFSIINEIKKLKDDGPASLEEADKILLAITDSAPFLVPQAGLESKGIYYADFLVNFLTTNLMQWNEQTIKSYICIPAIIRRFTRHMYFFSIKAEFAVNGVENVYDRRLDPSKVDGPNEDIYEIYPLDHKTGLPITGPGFFTIQQVADRIIQDVKNNKEKFEQTVLHTTGIQHDVLRARIAAMGDSVEKVKLNSLLPTIQMNSRSGSVIVHEEVPEEEYTIPQLTDEEKEHLDKCVRMFFSASLGKQLMWIRDTILLTPEHGFIEATKAIYAEELSREVTFEKMIRWAHDKSMKTLDFVTLNLLKVKDFVYEHQTKFIAAGVCLTACGIIYSLTSRQVEIQSGETRNLSKRQLLRARQKGNKGKSKTRIVKGLTTQMNMDQHYLDMSDKILKNYYTISFSNEVGIGGYIVFLYGKTAIIPHHYIDNIYAKMNIDPDFTINIQKQGSMSKGMEYDPELFLSYTFEFKCNLNKRDGDMVVDVAGVILPDDAMDDVKDITHFFYDEGDKYFDETKNEAVLVVKIGDRDVHYSNHVVIEKNFKYMPVEGGFDYCMVVGLVMPVKTVIGHCGALYLGPKGIIAMHVAGTGIMAYGIGIFDVAKELLAYQKGKSVKPIEERLPPGIQFRAFTRDYPQLTPVGNGVAHGTVIMSPMASVSAKIESGMHGCMGPTTLAPAQLGIGPDGQKPLLNANAKYARPKKYVNPKVMLDAQSVIRHKKSELYGNLRSSVDIKTAILGACDDIHNWGAVSRQGGMGTDKYNELFRSAMKGKTEILGTEGKPDLTAPKAVAFIEYVESYIDSILRDEDPIAVVIQFIKDELLKQSKVDNYDSRLIFATSFTFLVIGRMQYGPYICRTTDHDTHIIDGMGVGINPYADWPTVVKYMQSFGLDRLLAYDFKAFDASQSRQMVCAALDDMASYCAERNVDDDKIKKWIKKQLTSSFHMVSGYLVEYDGCNLSGNFATTYINGHSNERYIIIGLMCFLLKLDGYTLKEYEHGMVDLEMLALNYKIVTYGDDGLVALGPMFNGITTKDLAEGLAQIGVTLTNADKTDPYINPIGLSHIENTTFLKREFKVLRGIYVAPLDLASIQKSLDWTELTTPLSDFKRGVQTALYDLSYHGEDIFYTYVYDITTAYKKAGYGDLLHTTYEQCFQQAKRLVNKVHY